MNVKTVPTSKAEQGSERKREREREREREGTVGGRRGLSATVRKARPKRVQMYRTMRHTPRSGGGGRRESHQAGREHDRSDLLHR